MCVCAFPLHSTHTALWAGPICCLLKSIGVGGGGILKKKEKGCIVFVVYEELLKGNWVAYMNTLTENVKCAQDMNTEESKTHKRLNKILFNQKKQDRMRKFPRESSSAKPQTI